MEDPTGLGLQPFIPTERLTALFEAARAAVAKAGYYLGPWAAALYLLVIAWAMIFVWFPSVELWVLRLFRFPVKPEYPHIRLIGYRRLALYSAAYLVVRVALGAVVWLSTVGWELWLR